VAGLAAGIPQRRIGETRAARAERIRTRRFAMIGSSEFPILDEAPPAILADSAPRILPDLSARPGARLDFNGIVGAFAGGMSKREVGPNEGNALTCEILPAARLAEPFEALRDRADRWAAGSGRRPEVVLVGLGSLSDHAPRLNFCRNLFAAGGFLASIHDLPAAEGGAVAARAAEIARAARNAALICLCGTDEAYLAFAIPATNALREVGAGTIWLAGRPGPEESRQREAGIGGYVVAGGDAVATLSKAFVLLGG
jgi:methylmalonyl-CoA mutase